MKITKFYLLILVGAISFISLTAYISFKNNSFRKLDFFNSTKITDNKDIIKFNHKLHIKDNGMQCKDCHTKAPTSTSLADNLNPLMKDCESCHDVKDDKACNLCHYEKIYKPLQPTTKQLLFNHKNHLAQGKLCTDCHAGLDNVKLSGESVMKPSSNSWSIFIFCNPLITTFSLPAIVYISGIVLLLLLILGES